MTPGLQQIEIPSFRNLKIHILAYVLFEMSHRKVYKYIFRFSENITRVYILTILTVDNILNV